jgi:GNAT superfamily N-acetyltransferase
VATSWDLSPADHEHLGVVATCWGVSADDVRDRDRTWVQATLPSDAPGPRVVQLHDRVLTVLDRAGEVAGAWVPRMIGLRGVVRLAEVGRAGGGQACGLDRLRQLTEDDEGSALALHAATPRSDLLAASPLPSDAELAVGAFEESALVGLAAVVETMAGPPEVSVLVGPSARGRGVAEALERELLRQAAGRWEWLQHRTVVTDIASRSLAARCGFRLVSVEHLVRGAPTPD